MSDDPGAASDHAPAGPENTAERVALWRALHVLVDATPHVFEDTVGLALVDPPAGWRDRPDMDAEFSAGFRASIVARARFVEAIVAEQADAGVDQYVILGAGLDTFALRRPELAARMTVFEVDQPGPQEWKRRRLDQSGYGLPGNLRLVPVDFETEDWWSALLRAGFDAARPAVVVSTGVVQYLTREATVSTLRAVAGLAPGSTLALSFLLPMELIHGGDKDGLEASSAGAQSSGTPFISFFTPEDMLDLARAAGFRSVEHVAGIDLGELYFEGRPDGLRPSSGEDFLVARI
ncbi:class I SAM-dependent methyltransferase [Tomitella cavernea]|uniref:S-adenosyl-L-methionine-dependent methyltransferase n=1 Tax=Tomitella cavernea TaxID=1387982 RepID=A0ABP9C798_9ACTN|nr:class I SAM-dependent methyltransferase [Tomitella cavernea]